MPRSPASPLRPVGPTERAPKPRAAKAKSVTEAATRGTKRELLVAMRDRIASAVENPNTSPRDLAALTKRLSEVVNDIEAIDCRDEQDSETDRTEDGAFDASAV